MIWFAPGFFGRIEFKLQIDDPVGALGVHGGAAIWGDLAVGLFADGALPGIQVGGVEAGVWCLAVPCLVYSTMNH